jgi:hypothetical protein
VQSPCLGAFSTSDDCHDADNDHVSKKVPLINMRSRIRQISKVLQDAFDIEIGFLFLGQRDRSNCDFKDTKSMKPGSRILLYRASPVCPECASALALQWSCDGLCSLTNHHNSCLDADTTHMAG